MASSGVQATPTSLNINPADRVQDALSSIPRPAAPAGLRSDPPALVTSGYADPADPVAYPSGEVPPPHIVKYPSGERVMFPGTMSSADLNAAASKVWQQLKTRAGNVAKNVKAGVEPILQDVVDVSAPAVARQMYKKATGQPNTLAEVPGKVIKTMAPVLLGPEVLGEDEAASALRPSSAAEEAEPVLGEVKTTHGQVIDIHRASLTDPAGKEVGHVSVIQPVGDHNMTVNTVDLDPELRGQGYGKQLYSKVLDKAKEEGAVVHSGSVQTPEAERTWQSLAKQYPEIYRKPNGSFVADFRKEVVTPFDAIQMAKEGRTAELFGKKVASPGIPEVERTGNTASLFKLGKDAAKTLGVGAVAAGAASKAEAKDKRPGKYDVKPLPDGKAPDYDVLQANDNGMATPLPKEQEQMVRQMINSYSIDKYPKAVVFVPEKQWEKMQQDVAHGRLFGQPISNSYGSEENFGSSLGNASTRLGNGITLASTHRTYINAELLKHPDALQEVLAHELGHHAAIFDADKNNPGPTEDAIPKHGDPTEGGANGFRDAYLKRGKATQKMWNAVQSLPASSRSMQDVLSGVEK